MPDRTNGMLIMRIHKIAFAKYFFALSSSCAFNIVYRVADPNHRSYGKNQVIYRQYQIQYGNPVRSRCLRDKECIHDNIAGNPQHSTDILGNIFYKLFLNIHIYIVILFVVCISMLHYTLSPGGA